MLCVILTMSAKSGRRCSYHVVKLSPLSIWKRNNKSVRERERETLGNLLYNIEIVVILPRRRMLYIGNLKSDHSKSWNIWNLDFLKVGFQMVRFSNGQALATAIALVPTIWKPDIFVQISKGFWQDGCLLSGFQMFGLRDLDPIRNPDHLQPNLFLTIQIRKSPDYRSPL